MLEIPHTLVGAAIATKVAPPLLALPLAFLSHFVLDLIPHWNPSLYTETKKHDKPSRASTRIVVIDAVLSLFLGLLIAVQSWPDYPRVMIILLACFAAVLPDVAEAPYFFLNFRPKILKRLIIWQHNHQGRAKKIPGLLVQLITITIALIFIFA